MASPAAQTACIYVRVSSADQVDGSSLETQLASCRAYCQREGLTVSAEYQDAGESAKTTDRPQFLRMVAECRERAVGVVVVHKLDRFARNSHDYAVVKAVLAKSGTSIRSVTEPSTDDPAGRLMASMLAAIAEFDNDIRAERCRSGMVSGALAGRWMHSAPLGYITGPDATLRPDPRTAEHVRAAFHAVADRRMTIPQAAAMLRGRGIRITRAPMYALIRSMVYCGYICGKLTGYKPVAARFEGLVTREVWDRAQAAIAVRATAERFTVTDFILRPALTCAHCDHAVSGAWSRGRSGGRHGYYSCRRCKYNLRKADLEVRFLADLAEIGERGRDMMDRYAVELDAAMERAVGDAARFRRESTDALAKHERRKATLLDALLDGTVSREDYGSKVREMDDAITEVKTRIESAQDVIDGIPTAAREAAAFFDVLPDVWVKSRPADRAKLAALLYGGLTVTRDGKLSNRGKVLIPSAISGKTLDLSDMAYHAKLLPNLAEVARKVIATLRGLEHAA